ncbi:MAG: helix-turn-helix transcriptional regulator [Saprospiraceae bacterium]|nr:helix-turn-helix transcriptional regulator [Saprospiraceae bacterium]
MIEIHLTKTCIQETIRQYRIVRGYSQEYVAHQLDISQKAYSKIERGETKLTIDRLLKLSRIMEIPRAALYPD